MGEAQEILVRQPDLALERLDRLGRIIAQQAYRGHQPIAKYQQRGAVEVRDQRQQQILMAKLGEDALFAVGELGVGGVTHHDERVARTDHPRRGLVVPARRIPEPVITITRFEIV